MLFVAYADECDQLAVTISRVMEEAGNKVENEVEEIKTKYMERIKCLENTIKRLISLNEGEIKKQRAFDAKFRSLEAQLKQSHNINSKLDQELQIASKTIVSFGFIFNEKRF